VDLNGDGKIDLLSGSYSKNDGDMAGVLYALTGDDDGFQAAEPLRTQGDELLLIHTDKQGVNGFAERIRTKPWAADLDGDGHLDLVVGNMVGSFAFFRGLVGGGFEARSSFLEDAFGEQIKVGRHSDPVLVDWDGDGDLDLVSGSGAGGVCLFTNVGSKSKPSFAAREVLLPEFSFGSQESGVPLMPADVQLDRPGTDSRIAVHDFDGDGVLDVILTDRTEVLVPADGQSFEASKMALKEWIREMREIKAAVPPSPPDGSITDEMVEHNKKERAHAAKREAFAQTKVLTGAWWLRGRVSGFDGSPDDVR
jgi:hypothetical protein